MTLFQQFLRGVCLVCLYSLTATAAEDKNFGRDPDAFYLTDLAGQKPFILKVLKATDVYADRALQAYMKNFAEGDQVQLLAIASDVYYVKNLKTGYEGWVRKNNLSKVDKEELDTVMAQMAEEQKFAESIKKKEVLPGMTFEHVKAALGKPSSKTFRQDENGRFDKWSYVDYEIRYENQSYYDGVRGAYVTTSVPIKYAAGSLDVEFKSGRVTAIERTRDKNAPRY